AWEARRWTRAFPPRRSADLKKRDGRGRVVLVHWDAWYRHGLAALDPRRGRETDLESAAVAFQAQGAKRASESRQEPFAEQQGQRSEEHTSELQSRGNLVCRP